MKKLFLILVLFAAFGIFDKSEARYRGGNYAVDFFYHDLQPYGEWIEIDYDVFVWRPTSVNYSWQPYSIGRWVWSSDGWFWDSYEPFGWATYHYGRWFYDDYYGWVWMPDTKWGPSWVEWRYNDNYIGWAPLPPYAEFRVNIGIHFSISWRSNPLHWHFVRFDHFHHHNVHRYFEAPRYNHKIFGKTKYRTNYYQRRGRVFNGGIGREYVERRAGKKLRTYNLHDSRKRNKNYKSRDRNSGRIDVYRPSEDVMRKAREIDRKKITRGSKSTSLRTEKIAIRKDRTKEIRESDELVKSRTQNREKSVFDRNKSRDIKKGNRDQKRSRNYFEERNYGSSGDYGKESADKRNKKSVRERVDRDNSDRNIDSKKSRVPQKLNPTKEYNRKYTRSSKSRQNKSDSYSRPERRSSAQSYERKAKSSRAKTKSYSKPKSERKESSSRSYQRSSSSDSKSKSASRSGKSKKERVRSRR